MARPVSLQTVTICLLVVTEVCVWETQAGGGDGASRDNADFLQSPSVAATRLHCPLRPKSLASVHSASAASAPGVVHGGSNALALSQGSMPCCHCHQPALSQTHT